MSETGALRAGATHGVRNGDAGHRVLFAAGSKLFEPGGVARLGPGISGRGAGSNTFLSF